jgi:hypothetical protein
MRTLNESVTMALGRPAIKMEAKAAAQYSPAAEVAGQLSRRQTNATSRPGPRYTAAADATASGVPARSADPSV